MELKFDPFYQEYMDTLQAYNMATAIMYVDQNTIAPKKGVPASNKALATLSSAGFAIENNPETIAKIREYATTVEPGSPEARELQLRLDALAATENVPTDLYRRFRQAQADGAMMWRKAKEASDYEIFKPYLKNLMELSEEVLKYNPKYKDGMSLYDVQLDQYEPGMNQAIYDEFFATIKKELVPFLAKLRKEGRVKDTALLSTPIDVKRQEEFADDLLDYLQADPERVYLNTTEHPFTDFISHDDVRITTHYYPDRFLSAILSTVHEYGHALYALQMDENFDGTMLKDGVGSAGHESQSRFLENHIGRRTSFWKALYPKLVEKFPEFKDITPEELADAINAYECGLIRTEADELTYPLHILIRYEIEKLMAEHKIDYDKLPEIWADKYEEYLGVRPQTDAEGVLQDMHWSDGMIGYFPTYALGSAIAAQLAKKMESDLDVDAALEAGDLQKITDWQRENFQKYGALKPLMEIVEDATGKPFSADDYIEYLKDKYTRLYL